MFTIDGSFGEGGGQVLRTALALSLVTGQPFQMERIRAGRHKPGLQAQHLAAVNAAAAVGSATVQGAEAGSPSLNFRPQTVAPGDYHFAVGTAGSCTLVLQTVLPALAAAAGPSSIILEGGTHNPMAPPFEFLWLAFLPLFERMGPKVIVKLDRHGFYPVGGGKMRVLVDPVPRLRRLDLVERGPVIARRAAAVVANLPAHIAERELQVLRRELRIGREDLRVEEGRSCGPGNAVRVEIESGQLTEVFTSFGEQGVRAEVVANRLAKEVRAYLDAEVPVGEHLADQLLLPMALAGGGSFLTMPLTPHALTNAEVIRRFLPVSVKVTVISNRAVRVEVTIEQGQVRPDRDAEEAEA